jgi:hypothetical protein
MSTLCTQGEDNTGGSEIRELSPRSRVVEDPAHAEKLHAREPGDLRGV